MSVGLKGENMEELRARLRKCPTQNFLTFGREACTLLLEAIKELVSPHGSLRSAFGAFLLLDCETDRRILRLAEAEVSIPYVFSIGGKQQ